MKRVLMAATLLLSSGNVFAETPYAGMQSRTVKALSEQQVADLNAGRGMGMAVCCAYRKSSPSILVMQSTQDRTGQNAPRCLGGT
jgi:hypothetical protein